MGRACLIVALLAAMAACAAPEPTGRSVPVRYRGRVVSQRPRGFPQKLLALTFDDGPDPAVTPRILQALKDHGASATFFVLGAQARRYPALVKQEEQAGCVVGSHSFSHPASTSEAQAAQELDRTAQAIRQATGSSPTCFRPPYGITHGTLARLALRRGYTVVTWTISSADTTKAPVRVLADNLIHTPSPGDIALMHDGPGHARTAEAVPLVLDELTRAGYRFVTVPDLLRAWDRWLAARPTQKRGSPAPSTSTGR